MGGDGSTAWPARGLRRGVAAAERTAAADPDLQTLLAGAVARIAQETGCESVVAWGRDRDGAPTVLAACFEGPQRATPSLDLLHALSHLERATDLGSPDLPEPLGALPAEQGLTMAAPVHAGTYGPVAYLLAGGREDPGGAVRPRALAVLEAAARRLALPAGAALAAGRLARLDETIRRLHQLAALGDLVAEIAHEIRNPLVSVKTFLQLLPDRAGDPEFRERFFTVASEELRRLERLLDVILAQARPGGKEPETRRSAPSSFVLDSVAQLVSLRAGEKRVELRVDRPQSLPAAAIDEDRLRQVLLNLALNAVDVTPARSSVVLRARSEPRRLVLEVQDEGPGIPASLRERIFQPFFSTREERPGGLGLAISRRIVEEAGGRLSVEPGPKGGSLFRVVLPTE